MLRQEIGLIIMSALLLVTRPGSAQQLDAAQDGPIYGDPEGLARVAKLEQQLHNMHIREDHPRIILNRDNLPIYKARVGHHPAWNAIKKAADNGDMVNAAFVYQMTGDESYAQTAIEKALNAPYNTKKDAALLSLVFDWCYDVLTEEQRNILINRIAQGANLDAEIPDHYYANTFHSEEWSFNSWQAWPEVALAHHHPKAEEWYKARWSYDWVWGDAARFLAYLGDGERVEAYPHYGVELKWFLVLKSATGINLIDDPDFPYFQQAGYLQFYTIDYGTKRIVFPLGVISSGSILSFRFCSGLRSEFGVVGAMTSDPYVKWGMVQVNAGGLYGPAEKLQSITANIWNFIIYDDNISPKDPQNASWNELPLSKFFPGSKIAIIRSSFGDNSVIIGFRNPNLKRHFHVPAEANTFYIYRKGLLSGESGFRGMSGLPQHSSRWQFCTISHNNLLVIDPANPHFPSGNQGDTFDNYGGVETRASASFGFRGLKPDQVLLHNPNCNQLGGIPVFEASPEYTYLVGDAAQAYRSRLDEFYRSLVFIPKEGDRGYLIIFDRVEAKRPEFIKKWLMHFVDMPQINGNKVSEEVPGHIETFDGDFVYAENVKHTSALQMKVLLPTNHLIRRVGGEGYQWWRDDLQKNLVPPITELGCTDGPCFSLSSAIASMGGPEISDIKELGYSRIELMPSEQRKRDYFFNVMYIGDVGETMAPVQRIEEGGRVGALIQDPEMTVKLLFNKEGEPGGHITIVKNGVTVVDKEFAGGVEPPPEPLNIITPSLPSGTVGTSYSYILSASGGTSPYTWSLDSGSLPEGLSLGDNGVISGTPTLSGTYTFTVKVTDSAVPTPNTATKQFTITINPGDTTSPAVVTNLTATSGTKPGTVVLTWTAPGDDGMSGRASSYDIRYSTSPITENNWAQATQCTGEPAPQPAGSKENFTVTGLQPGVLYYFGLKATDDAGNVSDLSNVASAVPAQEEPQDTIPPTIKSLTPRSSRTVQVVFSEPVDEATAEDISNYTIDNGMEITRATLEDSTTVYLATEDHAQGVTYTIRVSNIKDLSGNTIEPTSRSYTFEPVMMWLEAEDGALTSPMQAAPDSGASGGSFIYAPTGGYGDGRAEYTIEVPRDGDYILWGRVLAPDVGRNSFFVSFDGDQEDIWDCLYEGQRQEWTWDQISLRGNGSYDSPQFDPAVFHLSSGTHTLIVKERERDTKLDKILLTNDFSFVPVDARRDTIPPSPPTGLKVTWQ